MSTPPNKSTLSAYATSSKSNKAQAGAVAVVQAIGSNIARGAASWVSNTVNTVSEHIPAARSATHYYTYDAKKGSQRAYKSAKNTLQNFVGGAQKLSAWMGVDIGNASSSATTNEESDMLYAASKNKNNNTSQQQKPGSPLSSSLNNSVGVVDLGFGNLVPGEAECHYTPQPTGLAGQVEVSRVQIQFSPVFVLDPQLHPSHQSLFAAGISDLFSNSNSSSSSSSHSSSSSSSSSSGAVGNNDHAVLCLSLVGPGGSSGFAVFRIDCSNVYEEVVELDLPELEALGAVKSVCVAEIAHPASSSSSSSAYSSPNTKNPNSSNRVTFSSSGGGGGNAASYYQQLHQQQQAVSTTSIVVVLTSKCLLQYNLHTRRVVSFQSLAFEASDLKMSSFYALVLHSGFNQVSVLSLMDNQTKNSSSSSTSASASSSSSQQQNVSSASNSSSSSATTTHFRFEELDVIVPDGDETAICDRWFAYVGSGSEAARISTRLLSYAQKTTTENISSSVHKGLTTIGGLIGSAANKVMQVSGMKSSPSAASAGGGGGSNNNNSSSQQIPGYVQDQQQQQQDFIFNPSAHGLTPQDAGDKPVGTVVIRDLRTKTDIAAFIAHEAPIQKMAFDSTGTVLATCAIDGKYINVFLLCPQGTATRATQVASAAAFSRLPRLPSSHSVNNNNSAMLGSNTSLYGLSEQYGKLSSAQDLTSLSSPTTVTGSSGNQQGGNFSSSSSSTSAASGKQNSPESLPPPPQPVSSSSSSASQSLEDAPCTTVIFTHRISRGYSSGTVTSLSFSQPWNWLACTTAVGTSHFFRLDLDRLANVEETIIRTESGLLPAVNVPGAAFRIRSAPSTVPPEPIVSFFSGECATGAGEQTTACVVTKTATVATAVLATCSSSSGDGTEDEEETKAKFPTKEGESCVSDPEKHGGRGVLLYEKPAAAFAGTKKDVMMLASIQGGNNNHNNNSSFSGGPLHNHQRQQQQQQLQAAAAEQQKKQSSPVGGGSSSGSGAGGARYVTAEAAWMELLHRRTQPTFAPLFSGVAVQVLPQAEKRKKKNESEDGGLDEEDEEGEE